MMCEFELTILSGRARYADEAGNITYQDVLMTPEEYMEYLWSDINENHN